MRKVPYEKNMHKGTRFRGAFFVRKRQKSCEISQPGVTKHKRQTLSLKEVKLLILLLFPAMLDPSKTHSRPEVSQTIIPDRRETL